MPDYGARMLPQADGHTIFLDHCGIANLQRVRGLYGLAW
jgi:hypothetical protein